MDDAARIREFLRATRRRALITRGAWWLALTLSAITAVVVALALVAARVGPAGFWSMLATLALLAVTLGGLGAGWGLGARRLASDRAVAFLVGQRHPPLASDLVSAIEFIVPEGEPIPNGSSPAIARAFHGAVADAVVRLDPRRLLPLGDARGPALALLATAALATAAMLVAPATLRRGLRLLWKDRPTRFEAARVADGPLVGDVRITYAYPPYTGLPRRVVEGSTGDVAGIKGTEVRIETRPLHSARQALLLFGDAGEAGEVPARIDGDKLSASFVLRESGSYRVWLSPLLGRPIRERHPHRVLVDADRPPEAEIQGPADRLELATPRPVEVAYSARDDFGLAALDLVYRIDDGAVQRVPLPLPAGARAAQGKTLLDPTGAALRPGSRIAYHVEARDADGVSGPKKGTSRTLMLVIRNPREDFEEQLGRKREVLDRMVATLANRLDLGAVTATPPASALPNPFGLLASWSASHEAEDAAVATLGRLVDHLRRSDRGRRVTSLAGMAERLARLQRGEVLLLGGLRGLADKGRLTLGAFGRLGAANRPHVEELESSVLELDDLIGRQVLDDLAALGRELTDAHKRLQDLLERYAATRDEALRRQIERELRALRARMQDLARQIAELKARNDVPLEWQNMPDVRKAMAQAERLDALLAKGDASSLGEALAELGRELDSLRQSLEGNAGGFAGERFPQEAAAAAELARKIGDLEGDQRALAGDGKGLSGEVDAEMERRLREQGEDFQARAREKLDLIRRKLAGPRPPGMSAQAEEDLRRSQEATRQLRRLLPAREWPEAKKEAARLGAGLDRLTRALAPGPPMPAGTPSAAAFGRETGEAARVARSLAEDLDRLVPRPETALSPAQRDRSRGLGGRQGSLSERTRALADEVGKQGTPVPGGEQAGADLRGVSSQMDDASGEFGRGATKEGWRKAEDIAERLARMRDAAGRRQMGGRNGQDREPVRVPDADDSRAPREWRQELLEAMRERGPEPFREEVRRYYEELVK